MRSPRVLLVEWHTDSREMYRDFLALSGFQVTAVATVDAAMNAVASADVAVIAANVGWKNGGLALARWLRLHEATRRLPIIVISTRTFDHDVARARAAGCDVFLSKPCAPQDLTRSIRWVFAWSRRGRPMIKASAPIARLASVRAVPGYQLSSH